MPSVQCLAIQASAIHDGGSGGAGTARIGVLLWLPVLFFPPEGPRRHHLTLALALPCTSKASPSAQTVPATALTPAGIWFKALSPRTSTTPREVGTWSSALGARVSCLPGTEPEEDPAHPWGTAGTSERCARLLSSSHSCHTHPGGYLSRPTIPIGFLKCGNTPSRPFCVHPKPVVSAPTMVAGDAVSIRSATRARSAISTCLLLELPSTVTQD